MDGVPPIVVACLTGFLSGLVLSIPVGPVNLTIMNEGARRGFICAALIGLGATVMEVIYCFIAFTGFATIFDNEYIKASMELFSFAFMIFLGIKFLTSKTVQMTVPLGSAAVQLEAKIEGKLHPRSAFMIGLVRVMANVGVLVFWVVIASYFMSRGWVTPDWPGKLSCVLGVALGVGTFFAGLSWAASRGYGRFSETTLLRMERFSGFALLGLGLIHGGTIAWHLSHRAK
jgi:threonine/homoserine/homoserine lactone efflux protein